MRQFSKFSLFRCRVECSVCLVNIVSLFCLITSLCFLLLSKDCWEIRLLLQRVGKNLSAPDTLTVSLDASVRRLAFCSLGILCVCVCVTAENHSLLTLTKSWLLHISLILHQNLNNHTTRWPIIKQDLIWAGGKHTYTHYFTPSTKILIKADCFIYLFYPFVWDCKHTHLITKEQQLEVLKWQIFNIMRFYSILHIKMVLREVGEIIKLLLIGTLVIRQLQKK